MVGVRIFVLWSIKDCYNSYNQVAKAIRLEKVSIYFRVTLFELGTNIEKKRKGLIMFVTSSCFLKHILHLQHWITFCPCNYSQSSATLHHHTSPWSTESLPYNWKDSIVTDGFMW